MTIINDTRKEDGWIHGETSSAEFYAKVYNEPSEFGINNSRISKLEVRLKNTGRIICNYDRAWDIKPKSEDDVVIYRAIYDSLIMLDKV